ncbi:MAG: protein phosphatase 2C domain-containing protein [Janthinobacterium lividum]
MALTCPKCGAEAAEGARFCEADGTRLSLLQPPAADAGHCRCGAGPEARDSEGYCTACGHTWPLPDRDHKELSLSRRLAGVSDLGKRHTENQDDFIVAAEQIGNKTAEILIVCDGVSSADRAAEASAAAVSAACEFIRQGLAAGRTDCEMLLRESIAQANLAVLALPSLPGSLKDPPETTIVAALVLAGRVTLAWVGDSRAYQISPEGVALLTHDHSWINEMVDSSQIGLEEARKSPQAHAITRCLGLEGEVSEPSTASFPLAPDAGLLLCSDGFWNYAESEQDILHLLTAMPDGTDAISACRSLTTFALAKGGHDNITVVLAQPMPEGTNP